MEIEHVARERFATRRAAQQQRDLTIGNGLLRQIVVDDERVLAVVHEVFTHGHTGISRQVLHRGRRRSGGGHDDRVIHRAVLFELAHHVGDGRLLLTDRDVDALNTRGLLIDDRVDGKRSLTGLTVTDDELALTATNRNHGVDGFVSGLHRLAHRLAVDHARRHALDRRSEGGLDRTLAIDWVAERVDDATEQFRTHRHFEDAAGRLDRVAFLQRFVVAEHDGADRILFEVQRETEQVPRELDHFAVANIGQAVDTADTVGNRNDRADVACFRRRLELFDSLFDEIRDLGCLDGHVWSSKNPATTGSNASHGVTESLDTPAQRAIDDEISRLHNRATDQSRIDVGAESHRALQARGQRFRQLLALLRRQRHGRGHGHIDRVLDLGAQGGVLLGDLRQRSQTTVVSQQLHEVARLRIARGTDDIEQKADEIRTFDVRIADQRPHSLVADRHARIRQQLAPRCELLCGMRVVERGARVRPCDGCLVSHGRFLPPVCRAAARASSCLLHARANARRPRRPSNRTPYATLRERGRFR